MYRTAIATAIIISLNSCASDYDEDARGSGRSDAEVTPAEASSTSSILATLASDTVLLLEQPEHRYKVKWTTWHEGRTEVRWLTKPSVVPFSHVELRYVNEDSVPDLFATVHFEEVIYGSLLFGSELDAYVVFRTGEDACRVPELRDVTGDGRPEVLEYIAEALSPAECRGDAMAYPCQQAYPTDWVEVWLAKGESFLPEPWRARGYYSELAREYAAGADRLQRILHTDARRAPSLRCDMSMVEALRDMALRARGLAGAPIRP